MFKLNGNILNYTDTCDVLIHWCNCNHDMNSGVSSIIKEEFPEAYEADLETQKGDSKKLGTFSLVEYPNDIIVVNAYVYLNSNTDINIGIFEKTIRLIKKMFGGKKILMPLFGNYKIRNTWPDIRNIINTELAGEDVSIAIDDEKLFYRIIIDDALLNQEKNIAAYLKGAHSLMGIFVGKAMFETKATADYIKLSNLMYNKIIANV